MFDISGLIGFERRPPSHQNAIDIFGDTWASMFPPSSGLNGGQAAHFDDARVTWAASVLGGLGGLSLLELGPFEAYNTYQFQNAGAVSITSIESNHVNFLKCLIVKNIFNLSASFLHGDFQEYLAITNSRFDVCWASGVLYHLTEPLQFLAGVRRVADTAFIWTQYYDETKLNELNDNHRFFDATRNRTVHVGGRAICMHHRDYKQALGTTFSGGEDEYSYWLSREDLMFMMSHLGYTEIIIGIDNPDHPPGPAMFFIARVPKG